MKKSKELTLKEKMALPEEEKRRMFENTRKMLEENPWIDENPGEGVSEFLEEEEDYIHATEIMLNKTDEK
jgi:hypothetical protein